MGQHYSHSDAVYGPEFLHSGLRQLHRDCRGLVSDAFEHR